MTPLPPLLSQATVGGPLADRVNMAQPIARTRFHSINGEAARPQEMFSAPNSLSRSCCRTTLPSEVFRHASGPVTDCTKTRSSSTVGVLRGPLPYLFL